MGETRASGTLFEAVAACHAADRQTFGTIVVVALRIALNRGTCRGSSTDPVCSRRNSAAPEKSLEADETLAGLVQVVGRNSNRSCGQSHGVRRVGGRRGCQTHVSLAVLQSYANFSFGLRAASAAVSFPRHDLYEAAHGHTAGLDSPGLVAALVAVLASWEMTPCAQLTEPIYLFLRPPPPTVLLH